jgi:transmembrane sensor
VTETARPQTADEINQAAAAWVARADRGLTAAEDAALSAWLAADARRAGAYMRMTAVLVSIETDVGAGEARALSRPPPQGPTRRQWLAGGGAIAASLAAAGLYLGLHASARFDTRKGEKRVVTLDDGSVVTLNTATRLEVRFSKGQRLIRLADGEALFDVAKDPARPFIVRAGDTDVRAIGTSFTVARIAGQPVSVLVREGVVELVQPKQTAHAPMRVSANTRATVAQTAAPVVIARIDPEQLDRELAWRQGRLVFAGESLSAAASQFSRYSDTRILIVDPELAGRGVAGVYDAGDPVGFAQAAALSLGAQAEIRENEVRISR